ARFIVNGVGEPFDFLLQKFVQMPQTRNSIAVSSTPQLVSGEHFSQKLAAEPNQTLCIAVMLFARRHFGKRRMVQRYDLKNSDIRRKCGSAQLVCADKIFFCCTLQKILKCSFVRRLEIWLRRLLCG